MGILQRLAVHLGIAREKSAAPPVETYAARKARRRRTGEPSSRIDWKKHPAAERILRTHYASKPPEIIAMMIAPLIPEHRVTRNAVIGRANRLGLKGRSKHPNSGE